MANSTNWVTLGQLPHLSCLLSTGIDTLTDNILKHCHPGRKSNYSLKPLKVLPPISSWLSRFFIELHGSSQDLRNTEWVDFRSQCWCYDQFQSNELVPYYLLNNLTYISECPLSGSKFSHYKWKSKTRWCFLQLKKKRH